MTLFVGSNIESKDICYAVHFGREDEVLHLLNRGANINAIIESPKETIKKLKELNRLTEYIEEHKHEFSEQK